MRGILRARRHSSSSVVAVCRLVMNKAFCMAKARVRRCRRCGRAIICASTDIFIFGSALFCKVCVIKNASTPALQQSLQKSLLGAVDCIPLAMVPSVVHRLPSRQ